MKFDLQSVALIAKLHYLHVKLKACFAVQEWDEIHQSLWCPSRDQNVAVHHQTLTHLHSAIR